MGELEELWASDDLVVLHLPADDARYQQAPSKSQEDIAMPRRMEGVRRAASSPDVPIIRARPTVIEPDADKEVAMVDRKSKVQATCPKTVRQNAHLPKPFIIAGSKHKHSKIQYLEGEIRVVPETILDLIITYCGTHRTNDIPPAKGFMRPQSRPISQR